MAFHPEVQPDSDAGQQFFADRSVDALMGSVLGLTTELLLLSVRHHRLERTVREGGPLPPADTGLSPPERQWVRERADALVTAWLAAFGSTP